MHRQPLLELLQRYQTRHPDERDIVARFLEFVAGHERCFERDLWAGHITGSAWLVDRAGARVLLTHHRKLGRWLQLGGHSDGDPATLDVARKEAAEESGLAVRALSDEIFDIDLHEIPARRQDPAHYHFDVRFALTVEDSEAFRVSAESLELAWVPIDELPAYTDEYSVLRMAEKWRATAGRPEPSAPPR